MRAWQIANQPSRLSFLCGYFERPLGQTVDLAQRLREQHVEFEELIFPDEIHDLLVWKDWIRSYTAAAEFLGRTLKPASQR